MSEAQPAPPPAGSAPTRVGLVLGAGGVMGGAWLTGALAAIATVTEWDPQTADVIVGTSAGSMIGSLIAAGVPPWFMVAYSKGESFEGLADASGRPLTGGDRSGGTAFWPALAPPPIGPGSLRLALRTLRHPRRYSLPQLATAWAPRGFISTGALETTIRRAIPTDWPEHPDLRICTVEYWTGRLCIFGPHGHRTAPIAKAAAASCAIPGFYHPVTIDGRRYVDGGIRSPSNLDLVSRDRLDLVICLNPTTPAFAPRTPLNPVGEAIRRTTQRRLELESQIVSESGADVIVLRPEREDQKLMGGNLMRRSGRQKVIESAIATTTRTLADPSVRRRLAGLPTAEPHRLRRPHGPVEQWPDIGPAQPLVA
jgi:NTE family protein